MDLQSTTINDRDWQLLSQLIDGELDVDNGKALEARLAAEPALRSALRAMRELNADLCEVLYRHPGVPPRVEDLLREHRQPVEGAAEGNNVVPLFPQSTQLGQREARQRWPAAAAASVALLVALGATLLSDRSVDGSLPGNDALVGAALDREASGDWIPLEDGRSLQPVLTFAHRDGNWCREFLLRGGDQDWRAVACRSATGWETQAAGLESYLDNSSYRPAGAGDSAPVAVFISQNAADIALDRAQEASLISSGWSQ